MRGSVVKRGAGYSVIIDLGIDPATGKRRQKWHSGFRTKKDAERAAAELVKSVNDGGYVEPTRQTVREFIDEWAVAIAPTVRPSTLHSYRRNMQLHVIPRIGAVPLTSVDAGTLNALYAILLESGRHDGTGGLSPRSVRYVHTILHRAMKDAVRWRRLAVNPADAADPPRPSASAAPEMKTWPAETVAEFLERSRGYGDRYFAAWHLLATTGLRRGEALGLRWADLDLEAGRAAIRQTVVAVNHGVAFGTPKTAKGRRSVALDAGTVAVLRDHRKVQLEQRMMLGAGWRDHDLVFTTVDGSPVHPERFSREFDRRIQRWSLPRIRLHDLRHTWATLALRAGVHPKIVSERLGHSGIAITLDIYSHVTPSMQSDAADLVAGIIGGRS